MEGHIGKIGAYTILFVIGEDHNVIVRIFHKGLAIFRS